METKKVESKRIERYRGTFLLIGIIIALSGTLVAFEWKSYAKSENMAGGLLDFEEDLKIQVTKQEKPQKPIPKQTFLTNFKITINGKNDDYVFIDLDYYNGKLDSLIAYVDDTEIELEVEPIVPNPEILPEYPGGEARLFEFISNNLRYPELAKEVGDEGIVYTSFYINTKGEIEDVKIERGVSASLDQEAIRVIKLMPKWKPAQQGIVKVKTRFVLPFKFSLK